MGKVLSILLKAVVGITAIFLIGMALFVMILITDLMGWW